MLKTFIKKNRDHAGLYAGLIVGALILCLPKSDALSQQAILTASVVSLMVICWLTETIPIAATALMPLVLFPILNINPIKETASHYSNPIIFMFLGGFMLAISMQHWQLHRRIALNIILRVGSNPRSMMLGFMGSGAFLSMWISNTATTLMMLPIALSIAEINAEQTQNKQFTQALLLAIAYSTSIGGMSTLIGTPPNAFMAGFVHQHLHIEITFNNWLYIGLPITLVGLPLSYFLLTHLIFKIPTQTNQISHTFIEQHLDLLGPMKTAERRLLLVFILTITLWLTRPSLHSYLPGLSDAGIAMLASLLLFVLPSGDAKKPRLLHWEWNKELPWGLLLLFGGGLSMADAINQSGLAAWIGQGLYVSEHVPTIGLIFIVSFTMLMLTELTSNTAATATFLPIMAALAEHLNIQPLLLVIPATLSASCAFMLPIATPPNAIVYGTEKISIREMMRAGMILNVLFSVLITSLCYWIIPKIV